MSRVNKLSNKFWDYIVDKYANEYDDFDADDGGLYIHTVEEYLDSWYDNIRCNVDKKYIDVSEVMVASIIEGKWELYEYDADNDSFDEVDWDDSMAGYKTICNNKGKYITTFTQNKILFVAKYYQ
jgi:hypothetical protein